MSYYCADVFWLKLQDIDLRTSITRKIDRGSQSYLEVESMPHQKGFWILLASSFNHLALSAIMKHQ